MDEIRDRIRKFLAAEVKHGREADLTDDADLIGSGLLDSLGIQALVGFLEQDLGIAVADEDLLVENFATVTAIERLVLRRQPPPAVHDGVADAYS